MSWLSSLGIGLLSGVFSFFGTCFIASVCVRWYRISSHEGAAGYYVVFLALLGGVVGLIAGTLLARLLPPAQAPTFLKGLGHTLGILVGVHLVALFLCWVFADLDPKMHGRRLQLEIEISCPPSFTHPLATDAYGPYASVELLHGRSQPPGNLELVSAKPVDGRLLYRATVPLRTSVSRKLLRARFNAEHDAVFPLPLRSRPRSTDLEWTAWIESLEIVGQPATKTGEKYRLRYRVQKVEPPPPPPSAEEVAARREAEERAKFEAIPADGPLEAWFPYTAYGADETRRKLAIEKMMTKPRFTAELSSLMVSAEPETAAEALRLVEHLPQPAPQLNPAVQTAGEQLIELIKQVNATPAQEDPSYELAAAASIRFSAWMAATRTLRTTSGGDFTAELGEILKLSRLRTDSYVMQMDIRRVASYYMQQWTGLAPLPGDPPPR